MNQWGNVDQDDIVRARNTLLASGRRTPYEEVDAYRVLAQVSPAAYLPLLVEALQRLSYDAGSGEWRPSSLELCEEALAVARRIDPDEPGRVDVLYKALDSYQHQLYRVGRRAEGLTLRGEMLAISRAQAERAGKPVRRGLEHWAAGLAEEGRYAEAADAMDELVADRQPEGPRDGALAWSLLQWIAALHDAGRSADACAAFERLGPGGGRSRGGPRLGGLPSPRAHRVRPDARPPRPGRTGGRPAAGHPRPVDRGGCFG
ncbi:hypothetical protein [Streptomyces parvus]|uniref:hypothetical protein n=1 Tax=Streptomyces parvus TaxID=66428 RepID=UPI00363293EA